MNFDGYDLCFGGSGGSVPVVSLVPVVPFRWFRSGGYARYAGSGGSVPVVSFRCFGFYHMPYSQCRFHAPSALSKNQKIFQNVYLY